MPILLPNLDDRRWADLVDEGRALIPLYAPEWTDHNIHDPGLTLMELFAWLAEMDIFQLNRISDRAKLKFLRLIGVLPYPPMPATVVLSFSLQGRSSALALPAEVEFTGMDQVGMETRFRTLALINIVPSALKAIQVKTIEGFQDVTERWRRGMPFGVFGDVPGQGAELYLGFDRVLSAEQQLSIFFSFAGKHADADERKRIIEEDAARAQACKPPIPICADKSPSAQPGPETIQDKVDQIPPYLGVRTGWELLTVGGAQTSWISLLPPTLVDDTRAFTLSGGVLVAPPRDGAKATIGHVDAELYYLRVRFEAGSYDAPPIVQNLAINAILAEQAAPVGVTNWSIAPGVIASPPQPPDAVAGLKVRFDNGGQLSSLEFVQSDDVPQFRILDFTAASATAAGRLSIEAARLGVGDGAPFQMMSLPDVPELQSTLTLSTLENEQWYTWRFRPDFDASTRGDRDFLLDPTTGIVRFGDGEKGMVLRVGAKVFATYHSTRAEAGNLRSRSINNLTDSPHNHSILNDFSAVQSKVVVSNPVDATGGTAAESLDHAIGRAIQLIATPQRAVTLTDYESLAKTTPGVVVARAKAWADLYSDFPCLKAPGMITVVVLPDMPVPRPMPSDAMRRSVGTYLNRRRIIGSRVEVVAPTYREVAVRAQVQSLPSISKAFLQQRVVDALNQFLNPLSGGPEGTGWPFGRDVYIAEILQVIDHVAGVDYVAALTLIADGCECDPQCGNVCLAPTWLATPGQHEIEVL